MDDLSSWRELLARITIAGLALSGLTLVISLMVSPLSISISQDVEVALWSGLVARGFQAALALLPLLFAILSFSFLVQCLTIGLKFWARMVSGALVLFSILGVHQGWLSEHAPLLLCLAALVLHIVFVLRFLIAQQDLLTLYKRGLVLRELGREAKRFSLGLIALVGSLTSFATLIVLLSPKAGVVNAPQSSPGRHLFFVAIDGVPAKESVAPGFLARTRNLLGDDWHSWSLYPGSGEKLPRWTEYFTGAFAFRWGISSNGMSRLPLRWAEKSVIQRLSPTFDCSLDGDWSAAFLERFPFGFPFGSSPRARFPEILESEAADNLVLAGTLLRTFRFGMADLPSFHSEDFTPLANLRRRLPSESGRKVASFVSLRSRSASGIESGLDSALHDHFSDLMRSGWLKDALVVFVAESGEHRGTVFALGARHLSSRVPYLRGVDLAPWLARELGVAVAPMPDGTAPLPGDEDRRPVLQEMFGAGESSPPLKVDDSDESRLVSTGPESSLSWRWGEWNGTSLDFVEMSSTGVKISSEIEAHRFKRMAQLLEPAGFALMESESRYRVVVEAPIR